MSSRGGSDRRERIRPAVPDLAQTQEDLFRDLARPWDDRRRLVLWMHKASARTLGRIPDEWPARVLSSPYRTRALMRGLEGDDAEDLANLEARLTRDDILLEASVESMRFIWQNASQYAEESEFTGRQFGPQKWLAMRPSLGELVTTQRNVLREVLGLQQTDGDNLGRRDEFVHNGLETHDDVARWVRTVIQASRGLDGGLSRDAIWSSWWRQALTGDPRDPVLHLDLAESVLGVFNRAIREEANEAEESPDEVVQGQRRVER